VVYLEQAAFFVALRRLKAMGEWRSLLLDGARAGRFWLRDDADALQPVVMYRLLM